MPLYFPYQPPIHQADVTLSQNNPVSGVLYTVLDTTTLVRIVSFSVTVTWTVQPSPLDLVITIDGNTLTFTQANPVSAQPYTPDMRGFNPENALGLSAGTNDYRAFILEGKTVKIEARTTGGTVSNLSARVKWGRWYPY
jgi:hypothetical protein